MQFKLLTILKNEVQGSFLVEVKKVFFFKKFGSMKIVFKSVFSRRYLQGSTCVNGGTTVAWLTIYAKTNECKNGIVCLRAECVCVCVCGLCVRERERFCPTKITEVSARMRERKKK